MVSRVNCQANALGRFPKRPHLGPEEGYSPMMRSHQVLCISIFLVTCGCSQGTKPAPPASAKSQPRETVRKYTQNVLRLEDALADGGQLVHGGGQLGPSGDYLGSVAEAYRSTVGTLAIQTVQQALTIYDIQNNGPVKSYEEFLSGVLKKGQPDGIQLPQLPYYQEYAFDVSNRQLVVVEFPARQEEHQKQAGK